MKIHQKTIIILTLILIVGVLAGFSLTPFLNNLKNKYNDAIIQPKIEFNKDSSKTIIKIICDSKSRPSITPETGLKYNNQSNEIIVEESTKGYYNIACLDNEFSSSAFTFYLSKPVIIKI
jgi:hypothetical protein